MAERADFLRRAILAIWDEPHEPGHVGVLHRMLYFYADMASERRAADQRFKSRFEGMTERLPDEDDSCDGDEVENDDRGEGLTSDDDQPPARRHAGTSSRDVEQLASPSADQPNQFAEIGEHLRDLHRIECPAHCMVWDYRGRPIAKVHYHRTAVRVWTGCPELAHPCRRVCPIDGRRSGLTAASVARSRDLASGELS